MLNIHFDNGEEISTDNLENPDKLLRGNAVVGIPVSDGKVLWTNTEKILYVTQDVED